MKQFRPQLLELGEVVSDWGMQVVCLTVTLALEDELEFFRRMRLSKDYLLLFWERITHYKLAITQPGLL
jgi:hypothetical protein